MQRALLKGTSDDERCHNGVHPRGKSPRVFENYRPNGATSALEKLPGSWARSRHRFEKRAQSSCRNWLAPRHVTVQSLVTIDMTIKGRDVAGRGMWYPNILPAIQESQDENVCIQRDE